MVFHLREVDFEFIEISVRLPKWLCLVHMGEPFVHYILPQRISAIMVLDLISYQILTHSHQSQQRRLPPNVLVLFRPRQLFVIFQNTLTFF